LDFEKVATFSKNRRLFPLSRIQKVVGRREPASIRAHFGFFLVICFFACGEGRRRVCGLPQLGMYLNPSMLMFFSIDFCKFVCLFACLRFGFFLGHFSMIFMPIKQCNVFFFMGQQA
jgi:hypothetical protein